MDALLKPYPAYAALGSTRKCAGKLIATCLRETLSDDDLSAIRIYLQQQRELGGDDFRAMIETKTRRFAGVRPAHRPPRNNSNACK